MNDVTKDLIEALLKVARMAEDLKKPCGMDPESPQAIRNAQYMNISYAARAAIARAEAALAEPQPDADGWIPWAGGECPVDSKDWVEAKLRDGKAWISEEGQPGEEWLWDHDGGADDIIAYRVVKS